MFHDGSDVLWQVVGRPLAGFTNINTRLLIADSLMARNGHQEGQTTLIGGGALVKDATLDIVTSKMIGNAASQGGGIADSSLAASNVSLVNCTLSSNGRPVPPHTHTSTGEDSPSLDAPSCR